MSAYLDFAAAHPRVYEAMFSMPSGLAFAADDTPEPLRLAFSRIHEAFPDADGTRAEVAWSALHGLATLRAGGRLCADQAQARLDLAHHLLAQGGDPLIAPSSRSLPASRMATIQAVQALLRSPHAGTGYGRHDDFRLDERA